MVSVVVATRDRTISPARCLDSVLASVYPNFEIIVVDNDPTSSATADLIESRYRDRGVLYVREDRRGLAAAHNRGITMAAGSILAFTDDVVVVDRDWLAATVEAFHFVANMSFRRDALLESVGFSVDVGRIGSIPFGCSGRCGTSEGTASEVLPALK
jgi:glycosyltransferase involved in cell wall biosynthesis